MSPATILVLSAAFLLIFPGALIYSLDRLDDEAMIRRKARWILLAVTVLFAAGLAILSGLL
jgi:hypothetical protein